MAVSGEGDREEGEGKMAALKAGVSKLQLCSPLIRGRGCQSFSDEKGNGINWFINAHDACNNK